MDIDRLFAMEGMDRAAANEYTRSAEEYVKFLRLFRSDMVNSKKIIDDYIDAGDMDNYTRAVHSLKSNSRIIGAVGLSAKAAELEALGKAGDWVSICSKTPSLMNELDKLYSALEPYTREPAQPVQPVQQAQQAGQHVESEELLELLELLLWAVRELDGQSAKVALDNLVKCELPPKAKELLPSLQKAVDDMEYQTAEQLIIACIS